MSSLVQRAQVYFEREVWRGEISELPWWRALPMAVLRRVIVAVRRGILHQLPIRASALTFVTVLSLVPSLAFAFSIAKALGAYERLREGVIDPFLVDMFGPVGMQVGENGEQTEQQLRVAIDQVLQFVENTDVKKLGALGFLVVVYGVIRLLGGMEAALNLIWSVDRPRRFIRKVSDYVTIVLVGPLLAVLATVTTASLSSNNDSKVIVFLRDDLGLGSLLGWIGVVLPILSMWTVFTLVYLVIPYTKVKVRSALVGGFVAAILFTVLQEVHVKSQIGVASYNQLYAGFAAFPLFLLWLWFSWLVVLAGAEFGYADQHQHAFRRSALAQSDSQAWYELNVMRALGRIVSAFERAAEPPTVLELVDELAVPQSKLEEGLSALESAGLLARTGDAEDARYVLARPAEGVTVNRALAMLRGSTSGVVRTNELDERIERAYRASVDGGEAPASLADVVHGAGSEA
ncbi:MAG: YihY/virulence factor BrkB family protein [Planctomycetota bacterium]